MITAASKVTLHFSLTIKDGDVVDSTFEKQPATFVMGDGSLLPGFEKHLLGLSVGDKGDFLVPQKEAFGAVNPQNIQRFKRSAFAADVELTEGLMMSFADAAGGELPGVIKHFNDNEVEVDFNHPLAGRELIFTVEIFNVE
jgi:FKBP-type peptidyl-prolyl cis-trans isomerase SlpA